MSVIQQIRDKAAWLVFGLIALSLIGFLAMDAFVGKSRLFGGNSNIIGTVNGEDIEYPKFEQLVEEMENQYKAQGYPVNDMMSQNIKNQVWDQFVQDGVLSKIYQKTGIDVSDKELNDMLAGQIRYKASGNLSPIKKPASSMRKLLHQLLISSGQFIKAIRKMIKIILMQKGFMKN